MENPEAQKGGEALLQKAIEDKEKRKEYAGKEIYQQAKEVAGYCVSKAREKVFTGAKAAYNCFECEHNKKNHVVESGKMVCVVCQNGNYFMPEQNREESHDQECE